MFLKKGFHPFLGEVHRKKKDWFDRRKWPTPRRQNGSGEEGQRNEVEMTRESRGSGRRKKVENGPEEQKKPAKYGEKNNHGKGIATGAQPEILSQRGRPRCRGKGGEGGVRV